MAEPRIVVLAEDLIWQTRLVDQLRSVGAKPSRAKTGPELDRELACADAMVVDLTARNYDPIDSIERVTRSGRPVIAVGQHEDLALRKRALAAGASRVYAYRKLFDDGPKTLQAWLAGLSVPDAAG